MRKIKVDKIKEFLHLTTFYFDLKQTRKKNKNIDKNFFALNNTHYNDINRYKEHKVLY